MSHGNHCEMVSPNRDDETIGELNDRVSKNDARAPICFFTRTRPQRDFAPNCYFATVQAGDKAVTACGVAELADFQITFPPVAGLRHRISDLPLPSKSPV